MPKTIIFLDFDGVLCDSAKESYLLARYAYHNVDVHEAITPQYNHFLKYRYLVSNSWQYYYLMQILEKNKILNINDIELKFSTLTKNGKNISCNKFNNTFISKRKELIANDFEFWNKLETPTLFLEQLKPILKNTSNCTFAILSTKNKEAIISKFNFWGIEFDSNFIFEKQDLENRTKGEFIDSFMNSNPEFNSAILIDDNEENIESCANIENLRAYLTSWGYIKSPKTDFNEKVLLEIIKENL